MPASILIFLIIIILILTICSIIVSSIQLQCIDTRNRIGGNIIKNRIGGNISKKIYRGGETIADFLNRIKHEIESLPDIDTDELKTLIADRFNIVKDQLSNDIEILNNNLRHLITKYIISKKYILENLRNIYNKHVSVTNNDKKYMNEMIDGIDDVIDEFIDNIFNTKETTIAAATERIDRLYSCIINKFEQSIVRAINDDKKTVHESNTIAEQMTKENQLLNEDNKLLITAFGRVSKLYNILLSKYNKSIDTHKAIELSLRKQLEEALSTIKNKREEYNKSIIENIENIEKINTLNDSHRVELDNKDRELFETTNKLEQINTEYVNDIDIQIEKIMQGHADKINNLQKEFEQKMLLNKEDIEAQYGEQILKQQTEFEDLQIEFEKLQNRYLDMNAVNEHESMLLQMELQKNLEEKEELIKKNLEKTEKLIKQHTATIKSINTNNAEVLNASRDAQTKLNTYFQETIDIAVNTLNEKVEELDQLKGLGVKIMDTVTRSDKKILKGRYLSNLINNML